MKFTLIIPKWMKILQCIEEGCIYEFVNKFDKMGLITKEKRGRVIYCSLTEKGIKVRDLSNQLIIETKE